MKKKYIITILFLVFILILYLLFKLVTFEKTEKEETLTFTEESTTEYTKPSFNKEDVNALIDSYIEENSCITLEYEVYMISDDIVNLYLDCGIPKNITYNYKEKKEITFEELLIDKEAFTIKVRDLLKLKYPTFVVDEIDVLNGFYQISKYNISATYEVEEYGILKITIDNNEIKDLLNYKQEFSETYENETFKLDPSKKTVAFTFDDGPSTYDKEIINSLTDAHYTATFFLVGNRINSYKDSVQKMVDTNMEVGNHSYNHAYLRNLSKSEVVNQITKTNQIYNDLTGKDMTLFRPPYGEVKISYLNDVNFPSIIWSVDTLDWQSRDADKVYAKIMNAKDGDIILMHSLYKSTADAVSRAVKDLYKKGFQVTSVSELAELKERTLETAKGYYSIK